MNSSIKHAIINPLLFKEGWPPQAVGVGTRPISNHPFVFPSLSKEGTIGYI
jgi:hypothetical protein